MTGTPFEPGHQLPAESEITEGQEPRESAFLKVVQGVRSTLEAVLFGILLFFLIRVGVQTYQVEGGSMLPTLTTGERVFVNKFSYFHWDQLPWVTKKEDPDYVFGRPQRGDIVVFNVRRGNSQQTLVKRVVGLPGERVTIRDGKVLINNQPLTEPYITEATSCGGYCDLVVPNDSYFLMGDNRNGSLDSRSFGPIPARSVIGKVWAVYWPIEQVTVVHHDRPVVAAAP